MTGIYGIQNVKTGRWYVGQSRFIEKRNSIEKACLNKHGTLHYSGHNHRIESDVALFGPDSFRFTVLEECEVHELDDKEMLWIEKLDSYQNGYNLTKGGLKGSLGWVPTEQQLKNLKDAHVKMAKEGRSPSAFKCGAENPMFGKKGYWFGKHHSEETKAKLRKKVAERDIFGSRNPHYGKKHTEEAKKRIGEASKNRKITDEWRRHISEAGATAKPVRCIETGEKYRSCREAANAKNIKTPRNIGDVCRGVLKTCGGLHWEFVDRSEFYPEKK